MLLLDILVQNSADCSQIFLSDDTGAYSLANAGGYGTPNIDVTDVGSAFLEGYYYQCDPNSPTNIPSVLLFPTVANPAPYALNESFILTPAMLGMTSTNFPDGVYVLTYTVYVGSPGTMSLDEGSPSLVVNDIITDESSGNKFLVLATNGTSTLTIVPLENIPSPGRIVFGPASISGAHGIVNTSVDYTSYTATATCYICCNSDCCMGQKLANIDPFCDCGCKETEKLFDVFMVQMGGKAAAGCNKVNSAIDDLCFVNKNCSCGCGCG
jgi:hypothetical protein